jgi:hypothetical protein
VFRVFLGLLALGAFCTRPALAQIDYRNLDDGRPVSAEDAWPIEHRALELLAPFHLTRASGHTESMFTPELGWGIVRNAMIGAKLPVLLGDGGGLAGPRAFAFYNLNAESPSLPGFALRADVAFPGGAASGDGVTVALKAIATRSWGKVRTHLNLARGFGAPVDLPHADAAPRWSGSLAADYTMVRLSAMYVMELRVVQEQPGGSVDLELAGGLRIQLTPTLVLDVGTGGMPGDRSYTIGLSHAFGLAALWPRGGK